MASPSGCCPGTPSEAAQGRVTLPFCKVGPSILNANLACLADECDRLLGAGADYLHLDVMDGHFVPNLTFGAPVVKSLRRELDKRGRARFCQANNQQGCGGGANSDDCCGKEKACGDPKNAQNCAQSRPTPQDDPKESAEGPGPWSSGLVCARQQRPFFEVHMMVSRPGQWVKDMADAGVDQFTFHLEPVQEDPRPVIRAVREAGMRVGLAINPATKLALLEPWADLVDCVLVMTVVPGFGGQAFMPGVLPKVRRLRRRYPELDIEVDGGLGLNTIDQAAEAGANMIVAGSAVTGSPEPEVVIAELRRRTQLWEDRRRAGQLPHDEISREEDADADEDPVAAREREEEQREKEDKDQD